MEESDAKSNKTNAFFFLLGYADRRAPVARNLEKYIHPYVFVDTSVSAGTFFQLTQPLTNKYKKISLINRLLNIVL